MALLMSVSMLTACGGGKSGKIFATEYDIEDYCEDAIIVSKTDGKVYGLLDNKGKEVLSLDYDDLYFANKNEYVEDKHDKLYLKAEREEYEMILDVKGKEILKSTGSLGVLKFELESEPDKNAPFFYERVKASDNYTTESYKFYNKDGDYLSEVKNHEKIGDVIWLSNKCYIEWSLKNLVVYNYMGEEMQRFDKGIGYKVKFDNMYNIYLLTGNENNDLEEVIIDAEGAIKSRGSIMTYSEFVDKHAEIEKKKREENKKNKPYNLYESNSTTKLEDWEGNALYEERYFDALNPSGENDCIALTNEDNQACIIGRSGAKYIDFGLLIYDEDEKMVYMVNEKDDEKTEVKVIHEGKNSIIIPIETEEGFDIYCYGK